MFLIVFRFVSIVLILIFLQSCLYVLRDSILVILKIVDVVGDLVEGDLAF